MQEIISKSQSLLGAGKTEEAIQVLLENNINPKGEIIHLQGRLNEIRKKHSLGVVSENFMAEQMNQIRYALGLQLNELQNPQPSTPKTSNPNNRILTFAAIGIACLAIAFFLGRQSIYENPDSESQKTTSTTEVPLEDKSSTKAEKEVHEPIKEVETPMPQIKAVAINEDLDALIIRCKSEKEIKDMNNSTDVVDLGKCLIDNRYQKDGIEYFAKAIELDEYNDEPYKFLSESLIAYGDKSIAKQYYELFSVCEFDEEGLFPCDVISTAKTELEKKFNFE